MREVTISTNFRAGYYPAQLREGSLVPLDISLEINGYEVEIIKVNENNDWPVELSRE
jgi:hypothetical protein